MPQADKNIVVLLVCANPRGTDPIRTAEEDRTLRESVQLSPHRDRVQIESLHAATIDDLSRALLKRRFDIVHFSGHGTETGLVFEGPQGRLSVPSSEALAELLNRRQIPTVILNACYSLSVGRLVGIGAEYTIASAGPIADVAAIEFTRGFYDAVGAGFDVPDAYDEGVSRAKLKGCDPGVILLRGGEERCAPQPSPAASSPNVQRSVKAESAFLVGFALDTSGSMKESIRNDYGRSLSRLESVQDAIRDTALSLQDRLLADDRSDAVKLFLYGFGLRVNEGIGDLISFARAARTIDISSETARVRARYEAEASRMQSQYGGLADLLRGSGFGGMVQQATEAAKTMAAENAAREVIGPVLAEAGRIGDSTVSPRDLAEVWDSDGPMGNADALQSLIYGSTPMKAAAEEIAQRFARTGRTSDSEQRLLILVSDGEPTDGDPREEFAKIRDGGVDIVSCFVTGADIADPRVLWAKPQPGWSDGAQLMFEVASHLDSRTQFARSLLSEGWEIEAGAKLFVQVNHSKVLKEFVRIAESFVLNTQDSILPAGR